MLVANVLALALPTGIIGRQRALRRLGANTASDMVQATLQPDRALALRNGETLTLTRRAQSTRASSIGTLVLFVVLSGEMLIVPVLPAVRSFVTSLLPLVTPPSQPMSPPSLLDWLTAAFPLVVLLACAVFLFGIGGLSVGGLSSRLLQVTADDRGVTFRQSRWRVRAIPWSDIALFFRGEDAVTGTPAGTYYLWGRDHFLTFTIDETPFGAARSRAQQNGRQAALPEPYRYENGFERYTADARRLLATIVVRANVPLRTSISEAKALQRMKRRFPTFFAWEAADALAAPEAGPPWQPSPSTIAAAPAKGSLDALLVLRPRLSAGRMLVGTLLWSLLLAPFFAAFAYWQQHLLSFGSIVSSGLPLPFGMTLGWPELAVALTLVFACAFAITWLRNRRPIILVDDLGITSRTGSKTTTRTIPWVEIRAWAVLQPRFGDRRGPTYFVFTDSTKISWREPEDAALAGRGIAGDRRAAYRERAEQIHALIAARTGLPLRELGLERPEPTVV